MPGPLFAGSMDPVRPFCLSVVQCSAGPDKQQNLQRVSALLEQAPPCDVIVLPEVFAVRGNDEDYRREAEPVAGPTVECLRETALTRRAWVLAGSIIEHSEGALYNTSVLLDRHGAVAAAYRKIHLFEATLDDGTFIREADTYRAGDEPVLADVEGWRFGLAICYDIRFPELFRRYAEAGAHAFFIPSNFTQRTGRDHWEVLVRARAIENQCFVVAPNQCGINVRTGVASHGHSMAVDPWGEVLGQAGDDEEIITVRLDPERLEEVRARIPVLQHRRLG